VLFDIQGKTVRSLVSGMFFSSNKELSPLSSSAMLRQNCDVRKVIVLLLERVQRFAHPGERGKSSNDPRAVPSAEQSCRA
jgi:hypothetical protein